jgi:hypothetical protein
MLRLNSDYFYLTNKKINIANTFEIFHEPSDNCSAADASSSGSKVGLDYTLRMVLEDANENTLIKDWRINASKYFITDKEYKTRQEQEESVYGYFTYNNLNDIEEWRLQGYAGVVPDLVMGESRILNTRFVSPEDSTKQTEEQFRSNLANQGYSQEEIDERVLRYLEQGGTFYVIDTNRYPNQFVALREAAISITTFSSATTPYFSDNLTDFFKVQETEPDPIYFDTLYADSFTIATEGATIGSLEAFERLASEYYDQSFNIATATDLVTNWNKYGFKFNSGSGGTFSDIGIYLKASFSISGATSLSNEGAITVKIYDNSTSDIPNNLLYISSTTIAYSSLTEDFQQFRWKISGDLQAYTEYWIILELSATPQDGEIILASLTPFSDFTYEEISSEAFSVVSLIDTNSITFSFPMRLLLNSDNTTEGLTNLTGQVNINIYSDNNDSIGTKLFTADSINFTDLTVDFATFTITASDISTTFTSNTKYWVVITESERTRGGIINSDLTNVIVDTIRLRIENTGRYSLWNDNNKKVWIKIFNNLPEIYGVFNREDYSIYKYLPGPNLSRQTSQYIQKEAYWAFTAKKFTEPSYVYIYPRAVGVKDPIPPNANSELDFDLPPANWTYVPYQQDIYVAIRLICGGTLQDYFIHLDPTSTPEPYLINSDVKAESIAYVYVAKTLKELQNGTHGAPPGDRLVIRSS